MPELFCTMFGRGRDAPMIRMIELAERLSLAFADRVLTVTREMRDNVTRRGADPDKITVIVNVPDDRRFALDGYRALAEKVSIARQQERHRGIFRVLCHGSIEERYGFDVIVRAIAQLRDEIPGIQFRFMGDGSFLPEILALADELNVEDHVAYLASFRSRQ